ncbi:MAG: hypothetical protein RMH77_03565 [Sulfolobales archaeon]|nr:hypothetical protein [Sulfolobales archaeon]MDW7969470.1 hypothetical protein [Sulfolobales archaeon]
MSYELPDYFDVVTTIGISALIIVAGYVFGIVARRLLLYLLTKIGFDEWFKKFAVGKAILRSGYSASEFFGLVSSWIIYLSFLLMAVASMASNLGITWLSESLNAVVFVYIVGFVKTFLIVVTGFIFTDTFISYIYKSSELRSEIKLLTPVAEYLRIMIYLAVVVFALEQGGLNIYSLNILLMPVIWGLTVAMVLIILAEIIQQIIRR